MYVTVVYIYVYIYTYICSTYVTKYMVYTTAVLDSVNVLIH